MDVSIIIVNYNSWKALTECLDSVTQMRPSLDVETIVVDNQSTDDRLHIFEGKYPKIFFHRNSANNGFAHGCNFGAAKAKGKHLLFLNPDTILNGKVIEHFVAIYQKENIGILSCLQTNDKNRFHKYHLLFPDPIRIFGVLRSIERKIFKRKLKNHFKETIKRVYPDWVSGSVVFISRENFVQIDKWNEDYWMYFEDVDLCKKAAERGLNVAITKEVSVFHQHGGASRINPRTKAITKSEVIKSKHTYIDTHFSNNSQRWVQSAIIANTIFFNGLSFIFSYVFFFNSKLKVSRYKFKYLMQYYKKVLKKKSWISERSVNSY